MQALLAERAEIKQGIGRVLGPIEELEFINLLKPHPIAAFSWPRDPV